MFFWNSGVVICLSKFYKGLVNKVCEGVEVLLERDVDKLMFGNRVLYVILILNFVVFNV